MKSKRESLLIRLVGLHSVLLQNDVELFFVVMMHLFDKSKNVQPTYKYDIKVRVYATFRYNY